MKNEKVAAVVENAVKNIKDVCAENEGDYGIIVIAAIPGDGENVKRHTVVVGNGASLASATTLAMLDAESLETIVTTALKTLPLAKVLKPMFDAL
jgi:hypothetical protein